MQDRIELFGRTRDGQAVHGVTLDDGLRAKILTYGGIVARLEVPGRSGRRDNVVLGLTTLEDYETRSPSFGATIGRYAGRIGRARFALDGAEYSLSKNDGANCLHGGERGFGKRVWAIEAVEATALTLSYMSADGEEGFPGALRARVRISIEGMALRFDYAAETDRPTVLNLTNHSYFNLDGEGAGDVFGHELLVEADQIVEVDGSGIPTGRLLDVAGTPFDFRTARPIGALIREPHPQIMAGLGYDATFVLRDTGVLGGAGLRRAVVVRSPSFQAGESGRVMTVRTDQPGVQVYTGNKLTGALVGPGGRAYRSGDGLALETQHFPDSPNQPAFPATVLRPQAAFSSVTEYAFSFG